MLRIYLRYSLTKLNRRQGSASASAILVLVMTLWVPGGRERSQRVLIGGGAVGCLFDGPGDTAWSHLRWRLLHFKPLESDRFVPFYVRMVLLYP